MSGTLRHQPRAVGGDHEDEEYREDVECREGEPREEAVSAWDGKEAARVGEGEEGGLVGGAEPGDPSLAGGAVLPMKLRVCRSGICLLSLCNSSYSLCCPLWPPKVVP